MNGLRRSTMRIQAAELVAEGAFSDFLAALRVGTPRERQVRADASLAAHQAVLDAYEVNVWWQLHAHGIDPDTR